MINLTHLFVESLLPVTVHRSPRQTARARLRVDVYIGMQEPSAFTLEDWPVRMRTTRATLLECPITTAGLFELPQFNFELI